MTEMNYYQLLRVARTASMEEIKDAYKEIAKVYHPDSNFYAEIVGSDSSLEGTEKFKLITQAYNTLSNAERRAAYNATLPPELEDWDSSDGETTRIQLVNRKSKAFRNAPSASNFVFQSDNPKSSVVGKFGEPVKREEKLFSSQPAKKQKSSRIPKSHPAKFLAFGASIGGLLGIVILRVLDFL